LPKQHLNSGDNHFLSCPFQSITNHAIIRRYITNSDLPPQFRYTAINTPPSLLLLSVAYVLVYCLELLI